ncbi:MAG: hypothetical protein JSS86_20490 [Cyanobacteria bacterium SZAS LIN-2]|nr:hypothetical protein [Cyanobacteria bacterium SZAS LIN-2]
MDASANPLPRKAQAVAAICLLYGAWFGLNSIASLFTPSKGVDILAFIAIVAGIGLLRRRRWCLVTLIWTCRLMIAATLLIAAVVIFRPGIVTLNIVGTTGTAATGPGITALLLTGFLVAFGLVHFVLTRQDVLDAFPAGRTGEAKNA